ncbi:MAG: hypothetical protein JO336_06885, partial [Acidobacteriia bacterium]|nr:hypothetical protein [Terriglobia bacterium]
MPLSGWPATDLLPPADYEGKPIQEIRFDPPSQPVTRADLARLFPLHDGVPLTLADVRDAIKKLYSTGLYSDIAIDAQPASSGLIVTIHTTEQWFVGPVEVKGKVSAPPNEGQLTNTSRLQLGTPFADTDIDTAIKGMQDILQRNGLYLAQVAPQISRDAEHQEVSVTFTVKSNKRAHLTLPDAAGDTRLPPEKLAKAAKYRNVFHRWKSATEANTQSGLQYIRKKYQSADRLTADVDLEKQEYIPGKNQVKTTIDADGGPKVKITTEGAKVSKKKLQKYVPVSEDDTLNRDVLVRGVRNLRDYFQNAGYFDVGVDFKTQELSKDEENITYTVSLGERQKLVRVSIEGNHYFKTDDIRSRMFLQP